MEEKTEKKNPKKEFLSAVNSEAYDHYEGRNGQKGSFKHNFGICSTCQSFKFAESEFKVLSARCGVFEVSLHSKDVVARCTDYNEIGRLSLYEMGQIAHYIDDDKKDPIGFNGGD